MDVLLNKPDRSFAGGKAVCIRQRMTRLDQFDSLERQAVTVLGGEESAGNAAAEDPLERFSHGRGGLSRTQHPDVFDAGEINSSRADAQAVAVTSQE